MNLHSGKCAFLPIPVSTLSVLLSELSFSIIYGWQLTFDIKGALFLRNYNECFLVFAGKLCPSFDIPNEVVSR